MLLQRPSVWIKRWGTLCASTTPLNFESCIPTSKTTLFIHSCARHLISGACDSEWVASSHPEATDDGQKISGPGLHCSSSDKKFYYPNINILLLHFWLSLLGVLLAPSYEKCALALPLSGCNYTPVPGALVPNAKWKVNPLSGWVNIEISRVPSGPRDTNIYLLNWFLNLFPSEYKKNTFCSSAE